MYKSIGKQSKVQELEHYEFDNVFKEAYVKMQAGITGRAQISGWRGNTSLEKRIEYDLYYIEN